MGFCDTFTTRHICTCVLAHITPSGTINHVDSFFFFFYSHISVAPITIITASYVFNFYWSHLFRYILIYVVPSKKKPTAKKKKMMPSTLRDFTENSLFSKLLVSKTTCHELLLLCSLYFFKIKIRTSLFLFGENCFPNMYVWVYTHPVCWETPKNKGCCRRRNCNILRVKIRLLNQNRSFKKKN